MPVSYTNRKGRTYFFCQSKTKLGRSRYFFTCEPQGTLAKRIPDGVTIQESGNGMVSLVKTQSMRLAEQEIAAVTSAVEAHPNAKAYRIDVKHEQIIIYERVGPDLDRLANVIGLNAKIQRDKEVLHRTAEKKSLFTQYTSIMRFTLIDENNRYFRSERMRFSGLEQWSIISADKPIVNIAPGSISELGTEAFFELN